MTRTRIRRYRCTGTAMLRAAIHPTPPRLPDWPEPGCSMERWRSWLSAVWTDESFRQAVANASPDLARQVRAVLDGRVNNVRRARRAALAMARYALRYAHRSTPFGLFAGVALIEFGDSSLVRIGDAHEAVHRPDPTALDSAITAWETSEDGMADVEVCVNNLARVFDGRVHVPAEGADEFTLASTTAVELVLQAAGSPIPHAALLGKLAAEFPHIESRRRAELVTDLLRTRLLRSRLRAAATITNPAAVVPAPVLAACERTAVDMRLDAEVRLPDTVSISTETAATVLARLATHPAGTPAWRRYIERFVDRFGEGTEVSVEQLTDPSVGLGLPDGFGVLSEPPRPMSRRDRLLLDLAGTAAVEGKRSVILSEAVIEELEAAAAEPFTNLVPAPHFEVCAQVQARTMQALDAGDFRLRVHTVSRAASTMTGRFWHLLPELAAGYAALPTVAPDATSAQLSFHPTRAEADLLTRAPRVLPKLVSVGEYRDAGENVLHPRDLVVGSRDGHLYLAVAATGERLELLAPTAINFLWNSFTPPLVRFLAEISRAATAQVTWFDWGAAWTLPFTPAVHYRRTVLVAARWQLHARKLPGRPAHLEAWAEQLHAWRGWAGVPERVMLAVDDQHLPLDLTREMDMDLLRAHLNGTPVAVLLEAPPPDADGWNGGRAHSIVVSLESRR
ncbi:lantibiotic dehydratase family protein [Nonomuraea sp. NN258]|uniref:lantibiotic dehydratase family protein n=1 Tax=Nonomuraea antri TaxID=2730852 RepID=UPI001568986B|nr:lantibiotic dehydratase family protein [Nonomuraea antri]NRQ34549.1 lantibiotic dehydratase family protein [Nonomuraea antri]